MKRTVKTVAWICAVAWTSACAAQEAKQSDEAKALSERRINLMRQRVETLSDAGAKEEEFAYIEKPLLRYNDAARGIADATVWGLGRKGRPRAVLVVEIVALRLLAPYLGLTLETSTMVIGIALTTIWALPIAAQIQQGTALLQGRAIAAGQSESLSLDVIEAVLAYSDHARRLGMPGRARPVSFATRRGTGAWACAQFQ